MKRFLSYLGLVAYTIGVLLFCFRPYTVVMGIYFIFYYCFFALKQVTIALTASASSGVSESTLINAESFFEGVSSALESTILYPPRVPARHFETLLIVAVLAPVVSAISI